MTRLLVLCLVVAISVSEGYAASLRFKRQLVPREFQNINIENYLKNERAVRFQLKCIIDDGPCDRIGKYLKVTIPELLVNQCANCDTAQRERAGKLVSHIQQNFPTDWERAVKKFQGGLVKAEDAERLESLLGVKLDPKLVAATTTTTTAAPVETTPVAKAAEVPSTSEVPIASSSAAPASSSTSSEAPASSSAAPEATSAASAAPVESTSVAAAVSEASSTAAAAVVSSTSESAAVVSTSEAAAPASSTAAAVAPSSSAAPVA